MNDVVHEQHKRKGATGVGDKMKSLGLGCLLLFSLTGHANITTYEIHGVKFLTPSVDRLFNQKNISFANMFCQENAVENASLVLVIDSGALDGKSFYFPSVASCNEARKLVKDNHKKCKVSLKLNSADQSAQVTVGNCL